MLKGSIDGKLYQNIQSGLFMIMTKENKGSFNFVETDGAGNIKRELDIFDGKHSRLFIINDPAKEVREVLISEQLKISL